MSEQPEPQENEELEGHDGEVLPDREVMSVVRPSLGDPTLGPDELPPIKEP